MGDTACFPWSNRSFLFMSNIQCQLRENSMVLIERFVVLLYFWAIELSNINEANQQVFFRKSKSLESIPPTEAASKQHTLKAAFQGVYVLSQSLEKDSAFEWEWDAACSRWAQNWITFQQAHDMCYEMIYCKYNKSCRGLCKCSKTQLKCTALCSCEGDCFPQTYAP